MNLPHILGRHAYDDACRLIASYGEAAGVEAQERADAARQIGNHIHFCHWRQIERLIVIMTVDRSIGTIH